MFIPNDQFYGNPYVVNFNWAMPVNDYLYITMLQVTCAIIEHADKILICQRSASMKLPLKWEFPGGKIEAGESKEDCLRREIKEEIDIDIEINNTLSTVEYHYSDFSIQLYPFVCSLLNGEVKALEHAQAIWVDANQLRDYDWAEADLPIVDEYLTQRYLRK